MLSLYISAVTIVMLWLYLVFFYWTSFSDAKKDIYFSYITSKSGGFIVSGSIPMVDYAIQEINNSTEILNNYTLHHGDILDSQCKSIPATDAFFEQFMNDTAHPVYLALICCGSSQATIPVAEISHYWNIPHLAFSAAATVLADKNRFKSFFQVLPPFSNIGPALTALSLHFGWRQMAIISQPVDVFSEVAIDMRGLFKSAQLKLYSSIRSYPRDTESGTIFDWIYNNEDYRIIFINAYSNFAYEVLCEAYRLNMFYPKYVWITLSAYAGQWWLTGTSNVNITCPSSHVERVLNGSIVLGQLGYQACRKPYRATSSGMTFDKFHELESELAGDYPPSSVVAPAYDTVWAVAMGLEIASQKIETGNDNGCQSLEGELLPLDQFNYTNAKMGCIIQYSIASVKFRGITGKFKFNENKTRQSHAIIFTQYNSNMKLVPAFKIRCHDNCHFSFSVNSTVHSIWSEGLPYDGYTERVYYNYFTALQALYTVAASFGIIFTVICFVFNNVCRYKKVVKLSSPNLNNIIIVGGLITYIAIYFTIYSFTGFHQCTQQTILCNFHYWLSSIGYTMCISVVLVKSGRAYYVFSRPNINKHVVQEWKLFIVCLSIVSINALILAIGTAIPSLRIHATLTVDGLKPLSETSEGISYLNNVYYCNKDILLIISFAYEVILQLVAIYLAFHTRQIKIRPLNDSRQIAAIVLINSLLLTGLVAASFSSNNYRDITVSMEALVYLLQATMFLGISFIPNMISLCFDPKGEKITKATLNPTGAILSLAVMATGQGSHVKLNKRIRELELELLKYKTAVKDNKKTTEELKNKIAKFSTVTVTFQPGSPPPTA